MTGRPGVRLSTAMVWFAGSYLAALVGYLAVQAIAGRMLGEASFGHFTLVMTTVAIVGQVGLVGAHRVGLRELPTLRRESAEGLDRRQELAEVASGSRAVLLTTLPVASLIAGLVAAWSDLGGHGIGFSLAVASLVWTSGAVLLFAHLARGMGRVGVSGFLEGRSGGALAAFTQMLALLVLWRTHAHSSLALAVAACAVAAVVPLLLGYLTTRPVLAVAGPLRGVIASARTAARLGWRFASNQLAALVNATAELWLASLLLGAIATSYFGAAMRLSFFLAIPTTVVSVAISPVVAREIAAARPERLEPVVRAAASLAAAGALVILVPMLLVPHWVVSVVLGSELTQAAPALRILALGMLVPVLCGQAGTVLTMSHHEGLMATLQWVVAGTRVVIGIAALLLFGLLGLAVSAAASTAYLGIASWWLARTKVGINTHASVRPRLMALRQAAAV